jgi:hypothetical protein
MMVEPPGMALGTFRSPKCFGVKQAPTMTHRPIHVKRQNSKHTQEHVERNNKGQHTQYIEFATSCSYDEKEHIS